MNCHKIDCQVLNPNGVAISTWRGSDKTHFPNKNYFDSNFDFDFKSPSSSKS